MRVDNGTHNRLRTSSRSDDLADRDDAQYLTVKQAGAYLALGPWRVRSLIWGGELEFVRLGRRILVDRRDLDRLLESKKERHGARR